MGMSSEAMGGDNEEIKTRSASRRHQNLPSAAKKTDERILWERVRGRQFLNLKFFRQYPFFHEQDGSLRFYVADFFCRERKAVVELDGPPHNVTVENDTERTEILSALSVRVVRFKNHEVENDLAGVLRELEKALKT